MLSEGTTDLRTLTIAARSLGYIAWAEEDYKEAGRFFETSLTVAGALRDPWEVGEALAYLAALAEKQGDVTKARRRYAESAEAAKEAGNAAGVAKAEEALRSLERPEAGRAATDDHPPDS